MVSILLGMNLLDKTYAENELKVLTYMTMQNNVIV